MAVVNIDGIGEVTVDEEFLSLDPDDQQRYINDIHNQIKGGATEGFGSKPESFLEEDVPEETFLAPAFPEVEAPPEAVPEEEPGVIESAVDTFLSDKPKEWSVQAQDLWEGGKGTFKGGAQFAGVSLLGGSFKVALEHKRLLDVYDQIDEGTFTRENLQEIQLGHQLHS